MHDSERLIGLTLESKNPQLVDRAKELSQMIRDHSPNGPSPLLAVLAVLAVGPMAHTCKSLGEPSGLLPDGGYKI